VAKNDLIGGSLWEQYSSQVSRRMNNPTHMGDITEQDARKLGAKLIVADWGAEACGDAVRLYWAVDPETDIIKEAKFKTFGCGTAIASCDVMCEMCKGLTVDEAMKINNLNVEKALRDEAETPSIPPQKMHCSVMAYDVIRKAASIYKNVEMEDLEDREIICECARVTLKTIIDVIRINDLKTVEEITQYTKAGAFCKSCIKPGGHEERKHYLVDILKETREKMELERIKEKIKTNDFKSMTLIQKHKAVERLLDNRVRKMLASDNGNVEVIDMMENGTETEVYLQYKGTCASCPSSGTGTLKAMEDIFQKELDPDIRIKIV
jgi:NifU-like protein